MVAETLSQILSRNAINLCPQRQEPMSTHLNPLSQVLFLLLFECELDEELLKLLVAIVDAELLKAVVLEDLEPINVQYPNHILSHTTLKYEQKGQRE